MNYTEEAIELFNKNEQKFRDDPLRFLLIEIYKLKERIKTMAIDQKTFDTDLAAFIAAFGQLVTAVDNLIASKPAADLTTEDQTLLTAAATVAAELNTLN